MHSREPAGRIRGGELRRKLTLNLTLRQHKLLERASVAERRPKSELIAERLSAYFADLERRFPDPVLHGGVNG